MSKKYIKRAVIVTIVLISWIQASAQQKADALNNILTYPVLYHQTSAEYRALCYQAFNSAKSYLETLLPTKKAGEKWAIVTDADETVIDNSYMEAKLIKDGVEYSSAIWNEWVSLSAATAIPGAVEFTKWAASKGIEIFYVSNRKLSEIPATVKNLHNLGFPNADEQHAIFMDKESTKEPRRVQISASHKIVLLMGDNLNDFSNVFEKRPIDERFAQTDKVKELWGKKFIVLPNPMYGEWESALFDYARSLTPDQKNEKLLSKLKSYSSNLTVAKDSKNRQQRIIIESDYLKCYDTVLIYLPKSYSKNSGKKTLALYLLHGWSGNYSNWSNKADLLEMADKYNTIIITPDGFYNSWYLNNIDTSKMQWRKFFHEELYPIVQQNYNTSPDATFITGLSMGGHGALNIFMDDTTKFLAAGSMSGVLNLQETRLKNDEIPKILGAYTPQNKLYDTESALNRIERLKGTKKVVLVTCGAQDTYAKSAKDFQVKAEELKIPNILILSPGVHSWKYWTYALEEHLRIFSQIYNNKNMGF